MYAYVFVLGVAIGGGGCYWWVGAQLDWLRDTHEKEKTWMWEEINRSRAQVARLVGTEPVIVAQSHHERLAA